MKIYAGTQEFVDFFRELVETLGLNIEYEVVDVDGELEIEITAVKIRFKTIKRIFKSIINFFKKLFKKS